LPSPPEGFVWTLTTSGRRGRDPETGGDLAADVVGHSRLTGADEDRTLAVEWAEIPFRRSAIVLAR
jgi:hypothetical protein